jgi:hypothetical protein
MKKVISAYLFVVILIMATGLFTYSSIIIKNKNNQITALEIEIMTNEGIISHQIRNDSFQMLYSGMRLDSSIMLTNESGDQVFINQLINRTSLFFKYTEFSCNPCIEEELQLLETLLENDINLKVMIISSYKDIGYLFRFKRINNLKQFPFYNIQDQSIISTLDEFNIPYYFTINDSFIITSLYIPSKSFQYLNKRYIINASNICGAQ